MDTFENALVRSGSAGSRPEAVAKKNACRGKLRAKAAEAVDFALAVLFAAIGGGLLYFGFHLLDIREKNLGYINVTVALAVLAGAAFVAFCVAAVVRGARRVRAGKK